MSDASASHLRALAADVEALEQRLHDALAPLDGLTPTASFRLGEASATLESAAQILKVAASEAAPA